MILAHYELRVMVSDAHPPAIFLFFSDQVQNTSLRVPKPAFQEVYSLLFARSDEQASVRARIACHLHLTTSPVVAEYHVFNSAQLVVFFADVMTTNRGYLV